MVLVGAALDLELESVALLGAALGAVVALVPDRTPLVRLGGFAAGFVVALIGYVVRAALLPDTSSGRAVAVVVVLLLCVGIECRCRGPAAPVDAAARHGRLVGAYEFTYAAAPPELMTTAVEHRHHAVPQPRGRLLRRVLRGTPIVARGDPTRRRSEARDNPTHRRSLGQRLRLNDMMETSK